MDDVTPTLCELARSEIEALLPDAKRHLIDAIGCAIGGNDAPVARIARRVALASGGGDATVFGATTRSSPELAAFANSTMIRCLDYNDTYTGRGGLGHPSDYIPAVLALAEHAGAGGAETLSAVAALYTVFCRLVDAANLGLGHWDHVVLGAIASAAAGGRVVGLDDEQLADAINIAAVSSVALLQTRMGEVSGWKNSAAGSACRNGVFAVLLAQQGLSGPPEAFTGERGFIVAVAPDLDRGQLRPVRSLEGCHLKRHPAGFFAQTAIDAALELYESGLDPSRIQSVEVGTFGYGMQAMAGDAEKWAPTSRNTADHSLPYLVANTLLFGRLDPRAYDAERLADARVRGLMDVLDVVESREAVNRWPGQAVSTVRVRLADGEIRERSCAVHRGHSANPMTDAEVSDKFMSQASALGEVAARRVLQRLWHIEQEANLADLLTLRPRD